MALLHSPSVVKRTREPLPSSLSCSHRLGPPYPRPLQSSAPGTLANTPFQSHLSLGCGTEQIPWENRAAKRTADSHRPESSTLLLKGVTPHQSLRRVIPLAFWQRVKKLLLNVQCELEVNRFFAQEEIMLGTGCDGGAFLHVPRAATGHWSSRHWSPGLANQPQPVGSQPVQGSWWDALWYLSEVPPQPGCNAYPLGPKTAAGPPCGGALGSQGPGLNLKLGQFLWHTCSLSPMGPGFCRMQRQRLALWHPASRGLAARNGNVRLFH